MLAKKLEAKWYPFIGKWKNKFLYNKCYGISLYHKKQQIEGILAK